MQLGTQQLRRDATFQGLVETLELALVLDRIPDHHHRLAHPPDRLVERSDTTLQFVGLLERRIDQQHRALFRRRQERPRQQPTVALVHGDPPFASHVGLEQAAVLGMQFVEQHAVLGAGQAPRQFRRARVVAQGAVRIQVTDHVQVIVQLLGQAFALPQAGDALLPLAGAAGLVTLQVVEADPGMAVQVGVRRVLAPQQGEDPRQHQVLEDIGMVAGVVSVTIVHDDCSLDSARQRC